jgi:SAM-dependent methyltransferase
MPTRRLRWQVPLGRMTVNETACAHSSLSRVQYVTGYVAANRAAWDRWSDKYQRKHGWLLDGEHAEAWGLWRLPECDVGLLGDVRDRDVLESGCGAARWSIALARRGARVVALDLSVKQLAHARAAIPADVSMRVVEGRAEALPFAPDSFDVVFSDYGAMSWADPSLSVPEVARVLRSGGVLVFCTTSPLLLLFLDPQTGALGTELRTDYFGMRTRTVGPDAIDFQLPYGEWISLFADSGLAVERLIEVRPPESAFTTFRDRPLAWARRWPTENIWRVRKT